jgi:hypothetical protein
MYRVFTSKQLVFHIMSLRQENINRLNPEQIINLARTIRANNPPLEDEVLLNTIIWKLLGDKTIELERDKLPPIDTSKYYKAWNHSLYKRTKRAKGEQIRPLKQEFLDYYNYNMCPLLKYNDKRHDYVNNYIHNYMYEGIRRLGHLQFWLTHKPENMRNAKPDVWVTCQNHTGLKDMIYDMWGMEQKKSLIPTEEIKRILGMI